jgi:Arc/MetJ-type ribon-helix-helix transcriptional regulator
MAMSVHEARDRVIRAALRALQAQQATPHRYSDDEIEYADEQLALAARDLTEATEAAKSKPVGWSQ